MIYTTIKEPAQDSFIEKKSKFIGYIAPCPTEEDAVSFINEIRALNRKAAHNCYAYFIKESNISRHSDDGEPEGTAGTPIYEVIRKTGLSDVCIVVTRYFGGILLGASGLVRAYSKAASLAVDAAAIRRFVPAAKLHIVCDYGLYGKISSALAKYGFIRIISQNFTDKTEICLYLPEDEEKKFIAAIAELSAGKASVETEARELYDFQEKLE